MKNKLSITFKQPNHGWLPLVLTYGDFKLSIEVSDVPVSPMKLLCNTLIQICEGIKNPDKVLLNLEPYQYFLDFIYINGLYKLIISEKSDQESNERITKEIVGDFDSLILPFYRFLENFTSEKYSFPHWEELNAKRIEKLSQVVKSIKQKA